MLRLTWGCGALPPRLLSEDKFILEFGALGERGFAGLPEGEVLVEGFDAQQRLAWRSHYRSASGLGTLLRQLRAEREIRSRNGG